MEKEKYTVENIVKILNKVAGIEITQSQAKIIKLSTYGTFGAKTWGKIDFLKKNGYNVTYVDSLSKVKFTKDNKENFEEQRRKKKKKGIDVLSNVKEKMKMSNFKIKK